MLNIPSYDPINIVCFIVTLYSVLSQQRIIKVNIFLAFCVLIVCLTGTIFAFFVFEDSLNRLIAFCSVALVAISAEFYAAIRLVRE
jgi:hypothetical protein